VVQAYKFPPLFFFFFGGSKTQPNYWTKRMASTRLATSSSRKNWRILLTNRSEIGTIYAPQCRVQVWWDHTIGPRIAKNGDNYCTALKRNMGRSAHGNLVQWVNLQNRIRAGSSYNHYPYCVISPAVAGCGSRSCIDNTSNWPVLYRILQFFNSPVLHRCRRWNRPQNSLVFESTIDDRP